VRLQIGLKGRAETTLRGRQFEIDGLIGRVIPSGQPLSASFGKNYQQLIVRIKTDALERKLASILGAKPKGRLEFSPATDLNRAYGRSLYQMILLFAAQLNSTAMLPPLALRHLQRAVTSAFLYGNRHSGKGRSRPDRRTTCKRAAMPDRHRSRHGNALCCPRADCAWSRRKASTAGLL